MQWQKCSTCSSDSHDEEPLADAGEEDGQAPAAPEYINGKLQFRYTLAAKKMMVHAMLKALTDEERESLEQGGAWPNTNTAHWKNANQELYTKMRALMNDDRTEILPEDAKKEERNVRQAAQKWTKRFLTEGSIHVHPPHEQGYKDNNPERLKGLAKIREWILEGCDDGSGGKTLYRDLYHLRHVKKDEFDKEMERTGLKCIKSVWKHLQRVYPKMRRVTIRLKKIRQAKPVKVLILVYSCDVCLSGGTLKPLPILGLAHPWTIVQLLQK